MGRHERQQIFSDILRDCQKVMTPGMVKEELERRGMTFQFVGQDMEAMRLMPFISIESRGKYRWKEDYQGPGLVCAGKKKRKKQAPAGAAAATVPPLYGRKNSLTSEEESPFSEASLLF